MRDQQLYAKEASNLRHVISAEGIQTDPKKTIGIQCWPVP